MRGTSRRAGTRSELSVRKMGGASRLCDRGSPRARRAVVRTRRSGRPDLLSRAALSVAASLGAARHGPDDEENQGGAEAGADTVKAHLRRSSIFAEGCLAHREPPQRPLIAARAALRMPRPLQNT